MFQIVPMDDNQQRIETVAQEVVYQNNPALTISQASANDDRFVLMTPQQIAPWLPHLPPGISVTPLPYSAGRDTPHLSPEISVTPLPSSTGKDTPHVPPEIPVTMTPMPSSAGRYTPLAAMSTEQQVVLSSSADDRATPSGSVSTEEQMVLATDASVATPMETDGSLDSGLANSEANATCGSSSERGKDLEPKSPVPSEAMSPSKPPDTLDIVPRKSRSTTLDDIFADLRSIIESKDEEIKKQRELYDENETLQLTMVSLREELQWKEDVVTELARKVERLEEQIAKLHVNESRLEQQLEEFKSTLRSRDKRISGLKSAVEIAQKALRDSEASEKVADSERLEDDGVIVLEEIPLKRKQAETQGETPSKPDDDVGPEESQRTEIPTRTNPSRQVKLRSQPATEENAADGTAATSEAGIAYAAELGLEANATRLKKSCPKRYRCHKCDKTYRNRKVLYAHKNIDCGKPRITCERCYESFRPRAYRQHALQCSAGVVAQA